MRQALPVNHHLAKYGDTSMELNLCLSWCVWCKNVETARLTEMSCKLYKQKEKEIKVKKLRTHVIPVPFFCSVLVASWLVLFPGLVLDAFAMTGRPPGLRNSKVVLPTFNRDKKDPCVNSDDFPTQDQLSPPTFEAGRAHYRTLTINDGAPQCDPLKWKIHDTVPEAATTPCLFLLHLPGVTSSTGIKLA